MSSVEQQPETSAQSARILVVDDEPVILDILRDVLEYEGFDVTTVGDGELALERLRAEAFDLLLTDLKMPRVDGLELISRLSDAGLIEQFKTVIMTGFGTVETAVAAMKNGAFDYILKPFKPEDVVRLIRRALSELELQRENMALRETLGFYELSEALSSSMGLDQQLGMIAELVRTNLGADGVAVHAANPDAPGETVVRFSSGPDIGMNAPRIFEELKAEGRLVAHGDEVSRWTAEAVLNPTGLVSSPLKVRGEPMGFIAAFSHEAGRRFTEGQRKGLNVFGARAASAIEHDRMFKSIAESVTATIESLARALETKDPYTAGHSDRVASYGRMIAATVGLSEDEQKRCFHGGLLHDIGKIGINLNVLNKAQKLTEEEYEMFKSHTVLGKRIIEPVKFLRPLIPYVYAHHEAWNGRGYPEGLSGEDIPFEGRLLAVADSYDAMTSNRPYRKALPHDIAVAELRRCAGKQFDRTYVTAFLEVIDEWREKEKAAGNAVPE
ncbi:MAG: HD domain-containing phosphohydrolase [Myxococcota bacterium]